MSGWVELGLAEAHREELLREAERWRLVRALREARKARRRREGSRSGGPEVGDIEVRWGTAEDEPRIADLLELNGIPRWIAFEERYVVAEKGGEILAALRYRTEPKRLVLGLLATDPWAEERPLAVALYSGAVELASELGAREIRARADRYSDYPREAGYWRRRGDWHLDAPRTVTIGEEVPEGRWRRALGLLGVLAVPFVGALRR